MFVRNEFQMKKNTNNYLYIALIGTILCSMSSCILSTDEYDVAADDGRYSGTMTVYEGPGTDPDFVDRTCPEVSATLDVAEAVATLTTQDSYPNYIHHPDVVTSHTAVGAVYENGKFQMSTGWAIEESDTQLEDLMTLEICDASAPSLPGDTSTGNRGRLQDFYMAVDDDYFVGEYGQGIARGTLIYGVRCNDGEEIPLCVYFMDLDKE